MERREFLKKSAVATTLTLSSGMFLSACERNLRSELMSNDQIFRAPASEKLDPNGYKILYYASYAPSGQTVSPGLYE